MDTNTMFSLMDIIILGCGAYILYAWYMLMYRNEIKEGVLVPAGYGNKCRDLDAYKAVISGKLLIFALTAIGAGAISLYSDYVARIPAAIYLGLTGLFLLVLIWFTVQAKKAQKQFFD